MIATRITPKVVWLGLALNLGGWMAFNLPARAGLTPRHWVVESAIRTVCLCVAYAFALALNLEVAGEYRQTRWLQVAWWALAANAGVSVIRIIVESACFNLLWPGYTRSPLWGLLQHLTIVPANIFLLSGLLAMWWAYHQVGLGFTVKRQDYFVVGVVLAMIVSLMLTREGLSEAHSPYALSRWLQLAGLILLSLSAAAGFVLSRVAIQMGGGKLAAALRFLTFYTLLRGVLVLVQAGQRMSLLDGRPAGLVHPLFLEIFWQIVPWIAALAAAYRAELTLHAARKLEQQRAAKAMMVSA
jgi:hypothetical protein